MESNDGALLLDGRFEGIYDGDFDGGVISGDEVRIVSLVSSIEGTFEGEGDVNGTVDGSRLVDGIALGESKQLPHDLGQFALTSGNFVQRLVVCLLEAHLHLLNLFCLMM